MQYFKPQSAGQFVGDCMPFFHEGTFHLFYLLDEEHHRARNGFGGHQWAHASSTDLVHWQHHPLAIPIGTETEFDYLSICTGSVFYYEGVYYGFYATRRIAEDGQRSERLCRATSTDGIHFTKDPINSFAAPHAWYDSYNFRDPFVFRDEHDDTFHMLVTACEREPEIVDRAGCLAHLISSDLVNWELRPPFIAGRPGRPGYYVAPECCDYFHWNGWYYLAFSDPPHATTYWLAREPFGPWHNPTVNTFDTAMLRVFKTAAFSGGRRLAVAFLTSLNAARDDGAWLYAGNAVFRELIQHEDGTLSTKWPVEMIPATAPPVVLQYRSDGEELKNVDGPLRLIGKAEALITGLPVDARITLNITPGIGATYFGLRLRGTLGRQPGYELRFAPDEQTVRIFAIDNARTLSSRAIMNVAGLDGPFSVDILLYGDIIDICVDNRRCLCTRLLERRGDTLMLWNEGGEVAFNDITVRALLVRES